VSEILNRFSLDAAKFNSQVLACLVLLWVVLVLASIVSINSQRFSERQRRFWILLVVSLPLFGILAYLPFSVRREDLPQVFLMKLQRDRWRKNDKKHAA
jgi:uncharacterized membrane protein YhaH (DUF805 family)